MPIDSVTDIARQTILLILQLALPVLLTALAVGVTVSLFQAATQVQEPTLSFLPKLLAVLLTLLVLGRWMLTLLVGFFTRTVESLPQIGP